ncbi:MAG TPA: DinB family protein [Lacibacter sp.]|nr:DinB family protein [Lacibacter sp.]HMO89811.1 DinB family protein [Lacibacter sp.]HMP87302.1 DinB family protein [Lacibacter sp.]
MPKPAPTDSAPFYHGYIRNVTEHDLSAAFRNQETLVTDFLYKLPEEKASFSYAPGKWTVAQVMQHLIDTERIFACRALWFARMSPDALPGFDENAFADKAPARHRSLAALVEEFLALRKSTRLLFDSLQPEELARGGTASSHYVTVNAIGFMTLGHFLHHKAILEERYL